MKRARRTSAFTLIEVVVALGLLAASVMFTVSLQSSISRAIAGNADSACAAQLVDAILVELQRLRDAPVESGPGDRLQALAAIIPGAQAPSPLRLVGAKNGTVVFRETDLDVSPTRINAASRFYLVEVRQQPVPLDYVGGAGFLAVTLRISWPYLPSPSAPDKSSPSRESSLVFNAAVTP